MKQFEKFHVNKYIRSVENDHHPIVNIPVSLI